MITIRIFDHPGRGFACCVPSEAGVSTTITWRAPGSILPGDWPDYRWASGAAPAGLLRYPYPHGPKEKEIEKWIRPPTS